MATRSTIALEYADGTVDQVYCHWDGYLDHNGKILQQHWRDPYKVQKMMELGDLSSLSMEIGEQQDFDDRSHEDWCKFYGRDRGEEGVTARRFGSFEDYVANHQFEEFEYILRTDGEWWVCKYGSGDYKPLTDVLTDEMIEREIAEDE
jgi:hypothetical protein